MVRVSIFIDGNNFYFGLKKVYGDDFKAMKFSFEKFCNFIADKREIASIFYYNAPLDITKDIEKYKLQQRFFDKLSRISKFNLVLCKMVKRRIKGTNQFYYVLKEDDIHMAGDMIKGAFKSFYDIAILVSGDGDFIPAVRIVRKEGKRVENIYLISGFNTPQLCCGQKSN